MLLNAARQQSDYEYNDWQSYVAGWASCEAKRRAW